jgi:hypothetical protein
MQRKVTHMSHTQENIQDEKGRALSNKREPRKPRGFAVLLFVLGVLVITGAVAFVIWQMNVQHAANGATGRSTPTLTTSVTPQKSGQSDPPAYYQAVEDRVAQGLRLSVAQIKAKLQAGGRGASLRALAAQKGILERQLWAILLDAEQKGHDVLVRLGYLTQDQSKQGMHAIQSWDLTTLDQHIRNYFLYD